MKTVATLYTGISQKATDRNHNAAVDYRPRRAGAGSLKRPTKTAGQKPTDQPPDNRRRLTRVLKKANRCSSRSVSCRGLLSWQPHSHPNSIASLNQAKLSPSDGDAGGPNLTRSCAQVLVQAIPSLVSMQTLDGEPPQRQPH